MTDESILFEAIGLLVALRKSGYCVCEDMEDFFSWLNRTSAVVYAYHYGFDHYDEEIDFFSTWCYAEDVNGFRDEVERARTVFNIYNHNNDLMWTVLAYLFENEIEPSKYTEQDCMNDDYYIEMGRIFKKILKDAAI